MEKQTTTKIILGLIIFIVFVFQVSSPIQAATTSSMSNLYSNPNQSGNNTYKFKVSDVVDSSMLTNIVGCTGVVNKVSTWMTKFISSPAQTAKKAAESLKNFVANLKKSCSAVKAGVETAGQSVPFIGGLAIPINTVMSNISLIPGGSTLGGPTTLAPGPAAPPISTSVQACQDQIDAYDPEALKELQKQTEQDAEANMRTQCFDGIAITLAKNQLTSMTRSMMNWVNSGYGGNPFFVQNMQDLTNNLERNVLETGIDILLSPGSGNSSPYAEDFASSAVTSSNLLRSSSGLLGNLQSSLENFITDPKSFYTNDQLNQAQITESALKRAQDANNAFANDFSIGGWNGWLALTQIDQNNPLGFSIQAADELAARQAAQVSQTQNELNQNNGFLSQKTCDQWQVYDTEDGNPKSVGDGSSGPLPVFQKTKPNICYKNSISGDGDCCTHFKIITPGSLIKDKVTNYINSPERQLELAKTINDSLNALFSVLLSKLEGGGLAGLSDASTDAKFNWTDNMNTTSDFTSSDGNSTYSNNGAYDSFNLTRDLGNTYIHTPPNPFLLGTWNASTNTTIKKTPDSTKPDPDYPPKDEANKKIKLYPDTAPEVYQVIDGGKTKLLNGLYGDIFNPTNGYYTVTTAGNTKLIVDGYNGWVVGDRAFWDGTKWQNWKCYKSTTINKSGPCDNQINPIKNRGVIQIQQDYIVAAKEILKVLPSVMPKLGELDYCIPGPNPSYQTNSVDAQSAYQDWVGSMYVGSIDSTNERFGVRIDDVGSRTYENLHSIHMENSVVWNLIQTSMGPLSYQFSNICNDKSNGWFARLWGAGQNCTGNYVYAKNGNLTPTDGDHLKEKTDLMNNNLDYVNSNLFQNFYEVSNKMMNKLYFNNITQKYLQTETSTNLIPNQDYIPMAESGYGLTKNMVYYNDDVTKAETDYNNAISQAKINIAALGPIENEVSSIIQDAQDRRNNELITKLGLSLKEIKTKYDECFAEENIQFYDADTITNTGSTEAGNCSDGIDNDLNGLIDCADTACKTNSACVTPNTNINGTRRDVVPNTNINGTRRDVVPNTNTSGIRRQ